MKWKRGDQHESMFSVYCEDAEITVRYHLNGSRVRYKEVERDMVERFKVWPHPDDAGDDPVRQKEAYEKLCKLNNKE